ncbi:MAG: T9SS type A sorting domain-containing protein [Ignavibacteria bacterium]|nr:T9SS type A sorting domain-containing protein [Ignavibacteria bacterium]
MKIKKTVSIAILFVLLATGITFSQSKTVAAISEIQNVSGDGTIGTFHSTDSEQIQQLVNKIKNARNTGDTEAVHLYQNQLNELTGAVKLNTPNINVTTSGAAEQDNLSVTTLNTNHNVTAAAIGTNRLNGDLYAVYARYVATGDEIFLYRSTNNGISWNYVTFFSMTILPNFHFRNNELDMEVVARSDSAFIWVTAGADYDTYSSAFAFKFRQDGQSLSIKQLNFPTTNLKYRFPRIASDNAKYSASPYVYIMYSLDSITGSTKFIKSKFLLVDNPYSLVPNFIEKSNAPMGAYTYYTPAVVPDSAFMQNDICFANMPGDSDVVIQTTLLRGAAAFLPTALYFSTTTSFGTIIKSSYQLADTKYLESPRIASSGYLSNKVMVAVRRLFSSGDWDPYYYLSQNFNTVNGNFAYSGYVSLSTDTTLSIDVAARPHSYDQFLFAYANKRGTGNAIPLARPFNSQGPAGLEYNAAPTGSFCSSTNGIPVAGFRFVNNDSCLIGWGNSSGLGYTVTGGCSGTMTGVSGNPGITDGYSLSQNYPNPFNPSTRIAFSIKNSSFVRLTVYNILGGEERTLVSSHMNEGQHEVEFNAYGMASGIYYYKLEAGGFSDVKKMILVK